MCEGRDHHLVCGLVGLTSSLMQTRMDYFGMSVGYGKTVVVRAS